MAEINPYAPTTDEATLTVPSTSDAKLHVVVVGLNAYCGVALSGGLFGAAAALFTFFSTGPIDTELLTMMLIGATVGVVWSSLFGLPTVILGLLILRWLTTITESWTVLSLRSTAAGLGAASGFTSLAAPGLLVMQPSLLLVAALATGTGMIGCLGVVEPLVRRVKRLQDTVDEPQ